MAMHPMELSLQGNVMVATLMPMPRFTITMVRFPRPMPLPLHTKVRLGLQGKWVIVAGSHPVVGGKLRFPLVKMP
jgi:hypothetical protein